MSYLGGGYPERIVGLGERNTIAAVPAGAEHGGVHRTRVQRQAHNARQVFSLGEKCSERYHTGMANVIGAVMPIYSICTNKYYTGTGI